MALESGCGKWPEAVHAWRIIQQPLQGGAELQHGAMHVELQPARGIPALSLLFFIVGMITGIALMAGLMTWALERAGDE